MRILPEAMANVRTLAEAALPNETGGILLGHRNDGRIVVEAFAEVRDESATPTRYERRHAEAQSVLDSVLASQPSGSIIGYVGEWHSHLAPAGPSQDDVRQFRQVARQASSAVALVVVLYDGRSWEPRASVAQGRKSHAAGVLVA